MVYKWVLRSGRMERIKTFGKQEGEKKQKHKSREGLKRHNRGIWNQELIKERKSSEMSDGELKIAKFLRENNIDFVREHYDLNLFNKQTNCLLFFDFYLPKYNAVIEFDGQHHYHPIKGNDALIRQKKFDAMKNKFCKRMGVMILRIPFWKADKIEIIICKWFDKHF